MTSVPTIPSSAIMRLVALILVLASNVTNAASAPALNSPSPALIRAADDFSRVAELLDPSVVNISTSQTVRNQIPTFWQQYYGFDPFGQNGMEQTYKRQSLGSGFVLSAEGLILTNAHVVAGADEVMVRLVDGTEYKAEVLGEDANVDLALLKIEPKKKLIPAALGDSSKVKVGEWAIAIGNPFGFDHSLTVGIISAKERTNIFQGEGAAKYQNYLQTDASINHGNSGGPLCNIKGEVIGMNTAISTPNDGSIGIGFAIPINFIKRSVPDLQRAGKVVAPKLGFFTQDVDAKLAKALKLPNPKGVLVTDVAAGNPAEKAGLKRGDVVLSFDTKPVNNAAELRTRIYEADPGQALTMSVWRDGKPQGLVVKPEYLKAAELSEAWHGLEVEENTPAKARARGLVLAEGVIVKTVAKGSGAERIGIKTGDLILEVNQQRFDGLDKWKSLTKQVYEGQDAVVLLVRGRQSAYIVLPAEQ
jgi:serine protease Do